MKKIIRCLIFVLLVMMNLEGVQALNRGSIKVTYHDATIGYIDHIETKVYKIGNYDGGKVTLLNEFKDCGIDINTINQKDVLTKQVKSCIQYIHQNHINTTMTKSSIQGIVEFNQLERGIYVIDAHYTQNDYQISIEPMFVTLPEKSEALYYNYDISLRPKLMITMLAPYQDYTVLKVWKDHNDEKHLRPRQIKVGLYKDEKLQETITLDALSNWSYTFKDLDSGEHWQVKELDIDSNYQSHVIENDNQFIIENTLKEKHSITTGDNVTLTFHLILICVSSILFFSLIKKIRFKK
ncbi:Cna B-type domain-containing protein [Coprobacillus sp. AF33-1AC]|uniref:Cna B-type domain-containing protein n=1 Tax=Coprobacillus sp. AF33-1AC TaxID=2292032 RepID=UPI000E5301EE|nr:Cna B-type domain-containing protein [Coprobacillus sp. AF33-1AC]RHM62827.1 Cna B-type domain-containing protein [Coprobacillus sp. AF33-1AC]